MRNYTLKIFSQNFLIIFQQNIIEIYEILCMEYNQTKDFIRQFIKYRQFIRDPKFIIVTIFVVMTLLVFRCAIWN